MESSSLSLINKYRPDSFDLVLGNDEIIKNLKEHLKLPSRSRSYLLTGPSGIGKTTIARILAKEFNAEINEIDAASNSGVDDMRPLVDLAGYKPLNFGTNRMYIIDECHTLSKSAWQVLLKLLEEPPPWLYIALATTEANKVPETIKTRAYPIPLKPVKPNQISDLLAVICEIEGWTVTDDTFNAILIASTGQPRKAISILQAGHACKNRDELSLVIAKVDGATSPVIELCKCMMKGSHSWKQISGFLAEIEDDDDAFESAARYIYTVMVRSDESQARDAWKLLNALTNPRGGFDRKANFAAAIGELILGQPF